MASLETKTTKAPSRWHVLFIFGVSHNTKVLTPTIKSISIAMVNLHTRRIIHDKPMEIGLLAVDIDGRIANLGKV